MPAQGRADSWHPQRLSSTRSDVVAISTARSAPTAHSPPARKGQPAQPRAPPRDGSSALAASTHNETPTLPLLMPMTARRLIASRNRGLGAR